MNAYSEFDLDNALLFDYADNQFPTRLYGWAGGDTYDTQGSTYFGYVYEGDVFLKTPHNEYSLKSRQYFCANTPVTVEGGQGIVIERLNYNGMNTIGGPVENWGRLKYIDGCTDTLLIPPVKMGDPCLNALFFPENINQTSHTHPSMRVGMVIGGSGKCVTDKREYDLVPGIVFIIHEDGQHKFMTDQDSTLTVIAYHPDSDFGPQDQDHPMINRTIVDGTSAAEISAIQTK